MPHHVERRWEGGGYGARRDRKPFRYRAFVPDPIADFDPELPGAATAAVAGAEAALASLAASAALPALEALATPLLRAEALGSSHIEGLRISNKRLAITAHDPRAGDDTALSVLGNVRAMERAISIGAGNEPLKVGDVLELHRTLLEGTLQARLGGRVREEQNWIGGRSFSPRDAVFIPPPETEVLGLLEDLIAYCNRVDLPVVAQAAIAHAQFETIHPFADGNGRAGRCLIHVILARRGLGHVLPPVSVALATNADRYVAGLTDFRAGRIADWVGSFATAVESSARAASALAERLASTVAELLERAGHPRRGSVARRIVESLAIRPILSAESVANAEGVTPTSARRALNSLTEAGVLQPTQVGRRRGREWACDDLFDLLDEFESTMAVGDDGRPSRPAPTRHQRST
jgi:Fic family protein